MVLRYTGRRSGRHVAIPLGRQLIDGRTAAISSTEWRMNFRGGRDAELLVAGEWLPVRGTLVSDLDHVVDVYERRIAELGWKEGARQLGVKVNAGRTPTHDELAQAVETSGLSYVIFDPAATAP